MTLLHPEIKPDLAISHKGAGGPILTESWRLVSDFPGLNSSSFQTLCQLSSFQTAITSRFCLLLASLRDNRGNGKVMGLDSYQLDVSCESGLLIEPSNWADSKAKIDYWKSRFFLFYCPRWIFPQVPTNDINQAPAQLRLLNELHCM